MSPMIYNVSLLVGLSLLASGTFLRYGLPETLIAAGAWIIVGTLFGRWIAR